MHVPPRAAYPQNMQHAVEKEAIVTRWPCPPAAFGRRHLAPVIADFLLLYPGLDVQLQLIDSFVDMQGLNLGKVDLVLRAGLMADTRLVATPLANMVRIACASPDYLQRRGVPNEPAQLVEHDGLDWAGLAPPFAWRFEKDGQMQLHRPSRVRVMLECRRTSKSYACAMARARSRVTESHETGTGMRTCGERIMPPICNSSLGRLRPARAFSKRIRGK